MLKITQELLKDDGTLVALEGKLLGPWVEEVRTLFLPGSGSRLDLSAVTFVDAAGSDLLRQLLREGVVIESCSAFVAALLGLNDGHGFGQSHHAR